MMSATNERVVDSVVVVGTAEMDSKITPATSPDSDNSSEVRSASLFVRTKHDERSPSSSPDRPTRSSPPKSSAGAFKNRRGVKINPVATTRADDDSDDGGDWSVYEGNDEVDDHGHQRKQQQQHKIDLQTAMSQADIEICQRLDAEYEQALEEREIAYTARSQSVRQSACFSVVFMLIYITLGTVFFLNQADWTVADSLLFSVYTITTVGYGNLEHPESVSFQLYTIFYIFIGIATMTIMVAQVYQWLSLETNRAQHARDQSEMARRGMDALIRRDNDVPRQVQEAAAAVAGAANTMVEIHIPTTVSERVLHFFERIRAFFIEHEIGRGLSVLFPFASLILSGSIVIGTIEQWTIVESLYFAVVSLTTVGFGDYYPTRTASIWFCVLWLPFSVGFMSLYLANVAAFYIRLSDKNIERIERQLRRHLERLKAKAENELKAARKRALRGQGSNSGPGPDGSDSESHMDAVKTGTLSDTANRMRGFDTVPSHDRGRKPGAHLFGSLDSPKNRRDMILANSSYAHTATNENLEEGADDEGGPGEDDSQTANSTSSSTMTTMRDVLQKIRRSMKREAMAPGEIRMSGPESEFLSIRSSKTVQHPLQQSSSLKPSFALRCLVQERFSEIIANDIAGYSTNIEIHEQTLSVTIDTLKKTADKWSVPRRARKAFRAVTFEALYFVGEHGLITRGANALYDLTPFEFHRLFAPLLAALGDADTMEGWLGSTQTLARTELPREATMFTTARAPPPHQNGYNDHVVDVSKDEEVIVVPENTIV